MISINELRIGNLVLINGKPIKIDAKTFHAIIHGFDGYEPEPIAITPEILEKCGFKYNSTRQSYYLTLSKVHDFSIMFNEVVFYIVQFASAGISPPVKHLHQLQNLYFALTGEELTIEL